jgi:hypothetical protein
MDADASFLWPKEDAVDSYFSLHFSMDKQR